MFSKHQFGETLKACLLALVLGRIGALYLRAQNAGLPRHARTAAAAALRRPRTPCRAVLVLLLSALAVFALIDVPLQRKWLQDRLKMSHQELKEEHKQLEGNVEVKSKMKALMRERVKRRMLAAVPQADWW
jgi:flagellar biosynthetic protein FlhB